MDGNEAAGQRILVVEDDRDSLLVLRRTLEREGYTVFEATDGRQAVEAARSERPDLILMDLNLPGVDGVEATRLIREMRGLSVIPVIAVTAMDPEEYRQRALLAGCNDYVMKPPETEQLLEKVRALLEAGRAARLADGLSAALGSG
jgi:two-component system cell cycle response regulator DivK